jgi:hypothetical protein
VSGAVSVQLSDLALLADVISRMDRPDQAPDQAEISRAHHLIMRMAGDQAEAIYAPDDGSSPRDHFIAQICSIYYMAGEVRLQVVDGEVPQIFEAGDVVEILKALP